ENKSEIYTLQSADYAYRVLIEEFQEGAINVTEEGLILYTNSYFLQLVKLTYDKVIGASIFDFIDRDSQQKFNLLFQQSRSGKSKGEIYLKDDKIPVYISLTSLQPKLSTVGIIISDLTEKKKNEKLIFEYQKDLESKNKQLLGINSELASFAYIASHDLQEPLRKIQTFCSRLLEKEYNNMSESGKSNFSRMQIAAKRMQTLIQDLLIYSRTNTAERNFEHINLREIVEEVKEDLREELQQKNATIVVAKMCHLNVIRFQFHQLLTNLINNSLKFSSSERLPQIEIKSEIAEGIKLKNDKLSPDLKYCHITFSDNGIGFEEQYSEKIFDLFHRLHTKPEYQGTGIGLAIVKKIVDNHNGIISAEGKENIGATFNIYIPAI
ncbi:MAG TPA: ATP-binding protein, partial [Chitinophagaceae bacterium]|nr:ATP-binding protein [Chitinophagaceae bacterium]